MQFKGYPYVGTEYNAPSLDLHKQISHNHQFCPDVQEPAARSRSFHPMHPVRI